MQDEDEFSRDALAAHVFYRALQMTPGLIRDWHKSIKDRQTATAIGTIVSRHFSPALIESELSVLKLPGALGELEDDTMSIKVPTGAPEISAKYIIDEQPLEIAIRLPSDFPLKAVEVKEVSRFGVTEPKWRGWLLNIQQMIMSRNGLILDALSLFKSNVGLHFEGKTECAIVSAPLSPEGSIAHALCSATRSSRSTTARSHLEAAQPAKTSTIRTASSTGSNHPRRNHARCVDPSSHRVAVAVMSHAAVSRPCGRPTPKRRNVKPRSRCSDSCGSGGCSTRNFSLQRVCLVAISLRVSMTTKSRTMSDRWKLADDTVA